MSPNPLWRPLALTAAIVICLSVGRPALAQRDFYVGPDAVPGGAFYVAEQSKAAPGAETVQPKAAPPAAKPELEVVPPADRAEPLRPPRPRADRYRRGPVLRLASVPNMLGDFFNQGGQLRATAAGVPSLMDIPLAGATRRVKIAENNKALPVDRFYLMYNHFHNALDASPNVNFPALARSASVERYTIGLEKTFLDGLWSAEFRMPFASEYAFSVPKFDVGGGDVGNLAISLKRLLAATNTTALAAGIGIDVPTGDDATGRFVTTNYTLHNDAVHLSPYLGFLRAPDDGLFYQGFAQVDVPLNGNRIDYNDTFWLQSGTFGKLTEQTLLHLDFSAGYWLYRNPCACGLTGLASLVELHYTTTLQDADVVNGAIAVNTFQFGNLLNQVDFVNLTVGLHAELAQRTTLRVAGVFPLESGPERPFDAEVQVQINRRF